MSSGNELVIKKAIQQASRELGVYVVAGCLLIAVLQPCVQSVANYLMFRQTAKAVGSDSVRQMQDGMRQMQVDMQRSAKLFDR